MYTAEYISIVARIGEKAFTRDAWNGTQLSEPETATQDSSFTTMCRLLQEIKAGLIMHESSRKMDTGHLARMASCRREIGFHAHVSVRGARR